MKDERSNPEVTCSRLPFGVYSNLPQDSGLSKSRQLLLSLSTTSHLAQSEPVEGRGSGPKNGRFDARHTSTGSA
jgi:hypothetical protein